MATDGVGGLRVAAHVDYSSPQVCGEGYPVFTEVPASSRVHHGYPRSRETDEALFESFHRSPGYGLRYLDIPWHLGFTPAWKILFHAPGGEKRANSVTSWNLTDVDESPIEPVSPSPVSASVEVNVDAEASEPTEQGATRKARRRRNSEFFDCPLLLPALGTMMARHHFATQVTTTGTLQGRVQVLRAGGLKRPRYGLYVTPPCSEEVLLMAAERQTQLKLGPYYVISSNALDFDRDSPCFLGRLSGNATCTQYLLHGQRISGTLREELAALRFRKPTDAPRRMHVVIPDGTTSYSSRSGQEGQLLAAAEGTMPRHQFRYMANTSPTWDAGRKVYRMNFHNRVTLASSKNFQLIKADSSFKAEMPESLTMQFGRVDQTSFSFDAASPLSALQAFAIALSVFDDRVYEALRIYY